MKKLLTTTTIFFLCGFAINLYSQCQASFTYSISGLTITVINTSTGNYDNVYWAWGDTSSWTVATSDTVSYTYSSPGTYWVNIGLSDSSQNNLPYGCDSAIAIVNMGIQGVQDLTFNNIFLLYPNPVQDKLSIQTQSNKGEAIVTIYSISGETLKNISINRDLTTVTLSDLSTGLYLYQISRNGNIIDSGKFLKE